MKNVNKALGIISITTLLMSPSVFANDWFIGAGVGYQSDTIKGHNYKKDSEDMSYQLRGGVIIDNQHRFTGNWSYTDNKFDGTKLEQHLFYGSYDYLYSVGQHSYLFGGVSMGVSDNKVFGKASTDFLWGAQVGAGIRINDNISTEIGYQYFDQDYSRGGYKIDDTHQIMASINYHF
ncbi:outer membrane beta-barrel protein [Thaumasiovibrio subtropicus]|uniref:outer membrane beta-barrel protein n=2 Tax=Thaumasiovibrio subtropicus TaxID=1891207 RepID=UPI001C85014F|nr:outer membrane beta-barrel protein [Thaumasiovibrio subtropicus]